MHNGGGEGALGRDPTSRGKNTSHFLISCLHLAFTWLFLKFRSESVVLRRIRCFLGVLQPQNFGQWFSASFSAEAASLWSLLSSLGGRQPWAGWGLQGYQGESVCP